MDFVSLGGGGWGRLFHHEFVIGRSAAWVTEAGLALRRAVPCCCCWGCITTMIGSATQHRLMLWTSQVLVNAAQDDWLNFSRSIYSSRSYGFFTGACQALGACRLCGGGKASGAILRPSPEWAWRYLMDGARAVGCLLCCHRRVLPHGILSFCPCELREELVGWVSCGCPRSRAVFRFGYLLHALLLV